MAATAFDLISLLDHRDAGPVTVVATSFAPSAGEFRLSIEGSHQTRSKHIPTDHRKLAVISSPEHTDITTGHALNQITPVRAPVIAVQAPMAIRNPGTTR